MIPERRSNCYEVKQGLPDGHITEKLKRCYKTKDRLSTLCREITGKRRVRLRRIWNVAEQFLLAATAQNLKRLVRFLAQREALELSRA